MRENGPAPPALEPVIDTQPSEQEIAVLYERYAPPIFHRALSILHNEEQAHDAVQETFARVIRNWEQFRGESSPYTWMYRITTNYCLNQIRNRKGRDRKHNDHRGDIIGEQVAWLRPRDEAEKVLALLEDADDETRQIVLHLFFDDMTREQTAAMVGISVPTLRKRLNRFLERARRALTDRPATVAAASAGLALAALALLSSPWGL